MAWTNFEEVLLDPYYTNLAVGGPEFATANIATIAGLDQSRPGRYDYISRYTIDYAPITEEKRGELRAFHIMMWGMAFGFRFLAPDDSEDEGRGWLADSSVASNPPGPAIEVIDEETLEYYLVKRYDLFSRTYLRRITKPAWGQIILRLGEIEVLFEPVVGPEGAPMYGQSLYGQFGDLGAITLDYTTGKVTFSAEAAAAAAGLVPRWYGDFHLPVKFSTDFNEMRIDTTTASEWSGVGIRELLPIALGILV